MEPGRQQAREPTEGAAYWEGCADAVGLGPEAGCHWARGMTADGMIVRREAQPEW